MGLISALAAAPPAAGPPRVDGLPVVQVVLFLDPSVGYQSTVAYARPVTREQAMSELAALAAGLGYASVEELRRTVPGEPSPRPFELSAAGSQTTLTFRVSEQAFNREVGTFKLEPMLRAYQAYGRIDLELVVGDLDGRRFAYRGPGDYESAAVRIRHHGQGTSHSFSIQVLDRGCRDFGLPPFAPPEMPLQAAQRPSREPARWPEYLLGALTAAAAAGVAFVSVYWLLRRSGRGSSKKARRRRR